jgi:hypothetical protein
MDPREVNGMRRWRLRLSHCRELTFGVFVGAANGGGDQDLGEDGAREPASPCPPVSFSLPPRMSKGPFTVCVEGQGLACVYVV